MAREIFGEYEDKAYPVSVSFIERKKDEGIRGEWVVRPADIEMLVVNNGELIISTESGVIKAKTGMGVILNCGMEHRITSSEKEDTAFFSVVFSPDYVIDTDVENSLAMKYYYPSINSSMFTVLLLNEANLMDEAALDRINDIIAVNTSKKRGYEILTKAYICLLWTLLLDYLMQRKETFNGANVPSQDELRVRSAIAFMQENYADPITLEDISNKIHVSRNECCRCFKRVMFMTPIDYLIRLRIFQAAKALYKDPLSVDTISELSFRTGFNNTSYFNKMFKRLLECTPKEFTKMIKDDALKAQKIYESLSESVTGV